jgi:ribonuclease III
MQSDDFSALLSTLDIRFKDHKILEQAFYHRSFLNEVKLDIQSNERLEFLGDAVLQLCVSKYLFLERSNDAEGDLTNLRAFIVKTKSLAQASKLLDLGSYLKLSKGEELGGGRENPQLLANTYEALLGAIYLDSGLESVEKVIEKTLFSLFAKELKSGPPKDAKSSLQEIVQEKYKESPYYRILETKGPDHAKQFIVAVFIKGKQFGKGQGASKQIAEEQSATQALERLISDSA